MSNPSQFVDNIGRRKWDVDEAIKKAELDEEEKANKKARLPVATATLKARDYKIDFSSVIGKTTAVSLTGSKAQQGGFYCETCDCVLKDSKAYITHINGRKHQRRKGMSMHVERSTLAQVKARIAMLKQQKLTPGELAVADKVEERVRKHRKMFQQALKGEPVDGKEREIDGINESAKTSRNGSGGDGENGNNFPWDMDMDMDNNGRYGGMHDGSDDEEEDEDGEFEQVTYTREQIQAELDKAQRQAAALGLG